QMNPHRSKGPSEYLRPAVPNREISCRIEGQIGTDCGGIPPSGHANDGCEDGDVRYPAGHPILPAHFSVVMNETCDDHICPTLGGKGINLFCSQRYAGWGQVRQHTGSLVEGNNDQSTLMCQLLGEDLLGFCLEFID